eukprot:4034157-Amphidinium_carterae.1
MKAWEMRWSTPVGVYPRAVMESLQGCLGHFSSRVRKASCRRGSLTPKPFSLPNRPMRECSAIGSLHGGLMLKSWGRNPYFTGLLGPCRGERDMPAHLNTFYLQTLCNGTWLAGTFSSTAAYSKARREQRSFACSLTGDLDEL